MLSVGTKAPSFSLPDKAGTLISLQSVNSSFTLVYFYPKDNTPGCTLEAVGFSQTKKEFDKLNTTIIGISGGDEKSKKRFCEKHDLSVTLLSDVDFSTSKAYGVFGEKKFMGRTFQGISRVSYLLDKQKKIIKVYDKVNTLTHHKEVLADIIALQS